MNLSEFCHVCAADGKSNRLRVYQINFDEAVRFCEDDKCTYPVGQSSPESIIVNRKYTEISPRKRTPSQTPQRAQPVIANKKHGDVIPCSANVRKILSSTIKPACSSAVGKPHTPYVPGKLGTVKYEEPLTNKGAPICQEDRRIKTKTLLFPQWQNKEALCWLDVVMCLFVHCKKLQESFHEADKSVLNTLFTAYNQACSILNASQELIPSGRKLSTCLTDRKVQQMSGRPVAVQKSSDIVNKFQHLSVVDNGIKTGAGMKLSSELVSEFHPVEDRYHNAFSILQNVRETVFQKLQPSLQCEKGKNDSPLFAIPLLVKGDSDAEKMMMMKYRFDFHCRACGYEQSDCYEQVLPTIPKPPENLDLAEPTTERSCFKCRAPWQQRKMVFEKLSEVVIIHFVEGLKSNNLEKLSFSFGGKLYKVRGLIQYLNNPDHFVTWIYDSQECTWMECDDLKSPVCHFQKRPFRVPAEQIHIIMWEGSPQLDTDKILGTKAKPSRKLSKQHQSENGETPMPEECKQRSGKRSVTVGITASQRMGVEEPADPSSSRNTEKFVSPSVLKPNMMVKLTDTGQIVQVPSEVKGQELQSPGQLPGNLSRNNCYPGESGSEISNVLNQATMQNQTERKTFSPALSNSTSVYTPAFLKSLIQRKSKNSLVLQAEKRTGKSISAVHGASNISKPTGSSCSNFRTPFIGKKKFEGYFSTKNLKSEMSQASRLVRSASVYSMSGDSSRPNSPAPSSYSDTFTVQKRKSKMVGEVNAKRRKSMCSDSSISSPESLPQKEMMDVQASEGCDVLQSLYSALNLTMPESLELPRGAYNVKASTLDFDDNELIPDIQDLADFIATPENDVSTSLDEFLAQL
ncbi:SUMO-specific isopeptidase USPL1-like [Saccostrea echinata]|uniref:SUMO-specific isopeptidase USPL1-like n=1 Tax=Saccostrea echinata TaxID=191078 RepID=UPI002A82D241|nr:SUMO-specific isopeptidase USPL1-like [Saccostrea echinata]XP_061178268.1 SUMO-specific isopeptidase USPL1-like [Saccostrea echinata]